MELPTGRAVMKQKVNMGWYEWLVSRNVPNVSPAEANKRLQADADIIVVDVRQPSETASGVVAGSVVIPLSEFGRRMAELPRDRPIMTICRSSHRSPIAARQLKRAGYDVTNIKGGIIGWLRAGLPLVRPGS